MERANPILAQKMGLSSGRATAASAGSGQDDLLRQMRRAVSRAADSAVGLSAVLDQLTATSCDAETLIEEGPAGWIVLGLRDGHAAGLSGLVLIDPPLRSALVEMQTIGDLLPPRGDERPVTRTDAVMTMPFADLLMKELASVGFAGDEADLAAFDMGPMDDLRTAGLMLVQGRYLLWQVTIQLGGPASGEGRRGTVHIAVRPGADLVEEICEQGSDWAHQLRRAVGEAPADLDAVLARMTLPISKIQALEVGQVLHLPGTTVGSVTLTGPSGDGVAAARLGQTAGKRAVRTETPQVDLDDSLSAFSTTPNADATVPGANTLIDS
ncbi:FliM/FliN family flagellar motor switch protein [Thalassorhabdomicrobium marinisediminis]|uniref:Flagellar motor switch protein FliN-like C-terminal domain-containing protein n=1 Tax=Thalassorhabdomicrobium marinisediminis TaxID=2170577 RepID=A0A2T7FY37_9RHOB|nr:FliM/FliN family flagellar motor switch protein [Thalassorhabdomicrobium marinisediminis]PVA07077.1 hypothetical protein DC363_08030 [Thalassorhabdomicrobium marinisediminis]